MKVKLNRSFCFAQYTQIHSKTLLTLCQIFYFIVVNASKKVFSMENEQIIRSSIREELPAGVLVADVSDNLRNHYQYTQNIPVYSDFFIVSKTSAVSTIFTVDQRTGKLATNKKIDRDTLCTVDHVCCDVHQNDNGYDAGAQGMSERKQLITFRRTADICQLGFRIVYKLKPSANNNSNMAETTGFCMVIVTILDINDNVPRFILPRPSSVAGLQQWSKHQMQPHTVGSFTAIEIWIDESAPLESCFPLPAAVDEDSTPYGISEYRLEGVTRSELLPLRQKLDHLDGDENSESDIPFTVSSMACKNDRTWDQSAQVIQNHENISPQHLKDASVLRGHSFNSPHLKLLIKLDRERREDYWLKLLALDGSQTIAAPEGFLDPNDLNLMNTVRHTSTLFIHVHVRDVNDNDPQVTPVLDIQVREDIKIGSVIGTVSGTDRDSGENGRLSYRLDLEPVQALSFPLSINPSTGAITVRRALDADRMSSDSQHQLVFKVLTSDFGRPVSRTVTTDVVIHLLDVNDETPQVKVVDLASQSNPPRPTVKENLPPGQLIAFVSATDADAGMNGAMSCRSTNKNFQLEPLSPASSVELNSESNGVPIYMLGDLAQNNNMPNSLEFKLITTTSLDREKSVYEMVEIICTDQALLSSDVRTGRARFLVTVLDDNDNAPTFGSAEIHIQVLENSAPHQLVTVFNASDGDSHPGPEEGSGQWDSRETDQLLRNQYNSGLLSRPDYYQTPKIRYSIDTTGEHYFHIDSSTGALYSRMPFDRESLQEIRFNVTADDGGTPARNTSALVIVTILDKNDNAPVFEKPLYDISLPENISPNSIIANLTAQDLDNGVNADLTYQMEDMQGTAQRKFRIDSRNGTLWVFDHLDREKRDRYTFKVHATDNGIPKQSSFCTVNIWVKDVNDNAPKFVYPTQKNHTIYASVFTSPGIPLVKLTAVDMDEGENAQLSFHLDGNAAYQKVFNLNEHSGELSLATLNDPMNFVGRYELVTRVQDAGNPPLSGYANINIVLNKSVASSSESSRLFTGDNKEGQSFEMLRHSNLKSWQSSSNTALDASSMSQRIQEPQENRASVSDYALHGPQSRKQESHQTGRKALSSSTSAPYFTSERALIVVICLIALSALIAFVFLIAITLIRRRTTAFDVGQLSQGHQRPSSAPPQAGIGRGSVKISEDKFSTLMSVPAISALEEPGIWSASGEFKRYPGSLGTAYEFVSRERCTPMRTTPTGTIRYEDKLDGDYTEQNQKPENGLQKPVDTYRYSPVASSNFDQWKVFLPELHPRTSNQNGDAPSCLVYPCETVQSQKSTENFPSVCLMLTQCDPRYERIKQCQRNKGCFDEPQDKFHNPAGHYSMQHLSQSPQEISSTARVKFVENADHYQDLRFSNYQPEVLMNNESNVRKDCMPMENNVEIEATEHDHGTPKSDVTPNS